MDTKQKEGLPTPKTGAYFITATVKVEAYQKGRPALEFFKQVAFWSRFKLSQKAIEEHVKSVEPTTKSFISADVAYLPIYSISFLIGETEEAPVEEVPQEQAPEEQA